MTIPSINQNNSTQWHKTINVISSSVKKTFEISKRILNSPTFWTILLGSASLTLALTPLSLISPFELSISALLTVMMAGSFFKYKKEIYYEIMLFSLLIRNKVCSKKNYKWFHKIDNNVYLGAIPLKEKDSINKFNKKNITSILSIIEDFEYRKTPFSTPISKDDWKKQNFTQHQIKIKDMKPLELLDIIDAVQFIKTEVKKGRKVYVHCKSGIGRSAMAVCCYFLEKNNLTPEQAVAFIKDKRPIIKIQKLQLEKIVKFYDHLQDKRKNSFPSNLKKYIPGFKN
ncbi:MAG: hypothetical protein K940chlam1_00159 [Candidatus Anoxychlamydiales bacterium]|nr:hypothetical protein [Candidatus Anoxychlamydiales bacterium]NGX36113.1 hypothetical protein [Candidatus Anoxychlamydiales bacterium]